MLRHAVLAMTLGASAVMCWFVVTHNAQAVHAASPAVPTKQAPTSVIEPTQPGDDLPPIGHSLFDFLTFADRDRRPEQVVPFPFASLIQRVAVSNAVLIPLGRSLQRTAAAPDFFAFPRVIIAADGERGMLLKDRLYLGYQEKANLIEVISYNEAAARFEFQLVKNYGPGLRPRVVYANRAVCLSCHQNAAPIFSRQIWDETNANPKVAALLKAARRDFHGITPERGVDVPFAIDNATERANRFALYQLLWREGCGRDDGAATRCRAALVAALLQYRLSGQRQFDQGDAEYREYVAERLALIGKQRWPAGLAVGNPDIPNRDPLPVLHAVDAAVHSQPISLAHVAAPFEPLLARPPLETWQLDAPENAPRLARGLAEFVAESDIVQLDRLLIAQRVAHAVQRREYRANCTLQRGAAEGHVQHMDVACSPVAQERGGLQLQARLEMREAHVTGAVDRLQLSGQEPLLDLSVSAGQLHSIAGKQHIAAQVSQGSRSARSADGNAIERLDLEWSGAAGRATAIVIEDFAPVREALRGMVRENADALGSKPFRRAALLPALFGKLGGARQDWCCVDDAKLPPAQTDSVPLPGPGALPVASSAIAHGAQSFYRYCASCHLTTERFPPNFLLGDSATVQASLEQCAERIYVRLSMWRVEPHARTKTPMPPETALPTFNLDAQTWSDSEALDVLRTYAGEVLKKQSGTAPRLDALLARGYENLRSCLADGQAVRNAPSLALPR
jgi:hypothetical protein